MVSTAASSGLAQGKSGSKTAQTFLSLGDWSALVDALRIEGFPVTPDREARLAALLWRLKENDVALTDWRTAASYLAPILCVRPDDHVLFRQILEQHYARRPSKGGAAQVISAPVDPTSRDRLLLVFFSIAFATVCAFAVWLWWYTGGIGSRPVPPIPGPTTNTTIQLDWLATDLLMRLFVAAPALLLMTVILAWRQDQRAVLLRRSARVDLEENYHVPFDRSGLFRDALSRNAFLLLKRAVRVRSDRLDVSRSVRATVAAGGWPTLHFRHHWTNVELVLLVDRGRTRDHLGYLASVLEDRLRAAQAFVTRYDYRFHPARLTLKSGRSEGPATQDLKRIAHRHTDHRLILLTDAEGLFLAGTNTLDPKLAQEFSRFGQILVLTPTPPEAWGERERALSESGAIVVPATTEGLDRASVLITATPEDARKAAAKEIPEGYDPLLVRLERDYHRITSDFLPPNDEIEDLAIELTVWAGARENFKVLAAVAAFPWIDPGLTLAFGAAILRRPVDPELFARFARLPWMRNARMPDWLRIALVNRLSARDRADVVERMTAVLSAARARPEGYPISADECAALPIAHEIDLFASADPAALGRLQERVFLSFLKGERLDPTDPLALEATEEMKRTIGLRFARRQRVFATFAFTLAAGLFMLKDWLSLGLIWLEQQIGSQAANLLPSESSANLFRSAAIVFSFAAIGAWAWRSARKPEILSIELRHYRLGTLWPFGAPVHFTWSPARTWLLLAVSGAVFAVFGIGDGAFQAHLLVIAALLTVCWVLWVRLSIAGSRTTVRLGYVAAEVGDEQDRFIDIADYPLGRAIAQEQWVRPSLAVLLFTAPSVFAVPIGLSAAVNTHEPTAQLWGVAVSIAGWYLPFLLCKRVTLGVWRVPDRSLSHFLAPIGDLLFAAMINCLFVAGWLIIEGISSWTSTSTIFRLASVLAMGCAFTVFTGSIALVGLRLRGQAIVRAVSFGAACGIVCALIILVLDWGRVSASGIGPALTFATVPFFYIGISLVRGWWHSRSRIADPLTLRQRVLRRRAAAVGALSFSAVLFFGATLTGMLWNTWLGGLVVFVSWVGPLFAIWRFVGPASVDIEYEIAAGRHKSRLLANQSAGTWWDTPWLALPAIALCGFSVRSTDSFLVGGFAPIAVVVATAFAKRHGRAALLPIGLGTFPFWLSFSFLFRFDWVLNLTQKSNELMIVSAGGAWLAVAALFWARYAEDGKFRARLMQRERVAWYEIAALFILFSLSLSMTLILTPFGGATLLVDPTPMLLSLSVIMAAGRLPKWPLLVGLAASASAFASSSHVIEVPSLGAELVVGSNFVTALAGAACVMLIRRFRKPTGGTLRLSYVLREHVLPHIVYGGLLGLCFISLVFFSAPYGLSYRSAPIVIAALGFHIGLTNRSIRESGRFGTVGIIYGSIGLFAVMVAIALRPMASVTWINLVSNMAVSLILFALFVALGRRTATNGEAPLRGAANLGANPPTL